MAFKMPGALAKYQPSIFASSDDNATVKSVLDTHKPDNREFDTKSVLVVIENIFSIAAPTVVITSPSQVVTEEDKVNASITIDALDAMLAYTIHKIACELSCRHSGTSDSHATTMSLLSGPLSYYAWDAKVVLVLAAFAMSYGEFWLTGQLHAVNPLAKSVALLKQLPDVLEHIEALKPRFDALNKLTNALVETTKCIIELNELPLEYISLDNPALSTAQSHMPTAVYWIIKSVATSSSQIVGLIGMSHQFLSLTSEAWELSSLAHKVNNIHSHLRKQLEACQHIIDEKKLAEAYRIIEHLLQTPHLDNIKILRAMFPSKEEYPLIQGTPQKKVSVDTLRKNIVLLLISDTQIMEEELSFLSLIYSATRNRGFENSYEIVWVPVMEADDALSPFAELAIPHSEDQQRAKVILELAAKMPWLTAYPHPHHKSAFVRYIKKEWHYAKKPILVVLDGQGKVTNPNAVHMLYIWGAPAFPFSTAREEALWKAESWKLDLVVDDIDSTLSTWIAGGSKYICLYGGEDINWIRSFTTKMKGIMNAASITIEMIYVGKVHPRAPVKKAIDVVQKESLSSSWSFQSISFFWARLDSMMHSKMQIHDGKDPDKILQEVITLLTYGNSTSGWALISKGSHDVVKAEGPVLVQALDAFDSWKGRIATEGFVSALAGAMDPVKKEDHCVRLVLPAESPVHIVSCPECKRHMERYLLFQCCDAPVVSPSPLDTTTTASVTLPAPTAQGTPLEAFLP